MINKATESETGRTPAGEPAVEAGKSRFIDAKRRGFLQGTAVAGAAALAGQAQAAGSVVATAAEEPAQPARSQGYRVTDHVRTYYDRARF